MKMLVLLGHLRRSRKTTVGAASGSADGEKNGAREGREATKLSVEQTALSGGAAIVNRIGGCGVIVGGEVVVERATGRAKLRAEVVKVR